MRGSESGSWRDAARSDRSSKCREYEYESDTQRPSSSPIRCSAKLLKSSKSNASRIDSREESKEERGEEKTAQRCRHRDAKSNDLGSGSAAHRVPPKQQRQQQKRAPRRTRGLTAHSPNASAGRALRLYSKRRAAQVFGRPQQLPQRSRSLRLRRYGNRHRRATPRPPPTIRVYRY